MDFIQALEQLAAALRDAVPVFGQYRRDLEKEGFSEEESFQMTTQLQGLLFGQQKKD